MEFSQDYQLFKSVVRSGSNDEVRLQQDDITSDFGSRTTPASERCQSTQSSPELDIYSILTRNERDAEGSGRNSASYGSLGDGGDNNSPTFTESFSPDVTSLEKSVWGADLSLSSGIANSPKQSDGENKENLTADCLINSLASIRVQTTPQLSEKPNVSSGNSSSVEVPAKRSCWDWPPITNPPPVQAEFSLWNTPAPVATEVPPSTFLPSPITTDIWSFPAEQKNIGGAGGQSNEWGGRAPAVGFGSQDQFDSVARQIAAGIMKPPANVPSPASEWTPQPTPDHNFFNRYGPKGDGNFGQQDWKNNAVVRNNDRPYYPNYTGGYRPDFQNEVGMGQYNFVPQNINGGWMTPPTNDFHRRQTGAFGGDNNYTWNDHGFGGPQYIGFVPPTTPMAPNKMWTGDMSNQNPFIEYQTRMQECYDLFKQYESDRKKIEGELSRFYLGRHKISSSNTIWIPHLPCFPSRIDKLLNDYYRETTKVTTLLIRMKELDCHVPNEVYNCANELSSELGILYNYFENIRVTRGFSAVGRVERDSEAMTLATAFKRLCDCVRRVRSASWLALTLAVKPEMSASVLGNIGSLLKSDDWWLKAAVLSD